MKGKSVFKMCKFVESIISFTLVRCFPNGPLSTCRIVADPTVFGSESLCPETPKYLEVHYTCSIDNSGIFIFPRTFHKTWSRENFQLSSLLIIFYLLLLIHQRSLWTKFLKLFLYDQSRKMLILRFFFT